MEMPGQSFITGRYVPWNSPAKRIIRGIGGFLESEIAMTDRGAVFRSGNPIPTSGIYGAIHVDYHIQPHRVFCIENQSFPRCSKCGEMEFQFEQPYQYVLEHEAFKT